MIEHDCNTAGCYPESGGYVPSEEHEEAVRKIKALAALRVALRD